MSSYHYPLKRNLHPNIRHFLFAPPYSRPFEKRGNSAKSPPRSPGTRNYSHRLLLTSLSFNPQRAAGGIDRLVCPRMEETGFENTLRMRPASSPEGCNGILPALS